MGSSAEGCEVTRMFRWDARILTNNSHEDVPAILQS